MRKVILSIASMAALISASAAAPASLVTALSDSTIQSHWSTDVRAGYAFNSNRVLMDRLRPDATIGHAAADFHIHYAFSRPESGRTASVYQGLGLSVGTFFQSSTVGTPIGIYAFQGAPFAIVGERLSFEYEWNFGATFGWKKTTDGDDIRSNLVVGSSTNAYLNLGIMGRYALSNNLALTAGLNLSHYSNGNTSWPNPGVNTIGGRIGLVYTPGSSPLTLRSPFTSDADFSQGVSYDVTLFGAWRKAYFPADDGAFTELGEQALLPGHFGVAGINVAPMWDIHPTFRAGLSADIQWSENTGLTPYHIPDTYGEDAKFTRPPFFKQVSLGLSARAELVMPIFSLNVGLGYGLAGPSETRKFYQTVNLKTYIWGPAYLNIGYRLVEFHSPSNLMLGVGITLGR
ncbi:MAG: acyloxyacyl hydrolase [Bacteroidales bacterium]|nr:acyloxyacyl hydrolase [Bacteroidales bacterium]